MTPGWGWHASRRQSDGAMFGDAGREPGSTRVAMMPDRSVGTVDVRPAHRVRLDCVRCILS